MIYESISLSTSNPSWFIVEESPYHFIRSLIPDLPDEPGPHVLRSELPGQGLRVIRELHGRHGQPLVRPARLTGARSPVVASIRVWPHRWLRLPRPGLQSSSPDLQAALNLPSTAGSMAHWWLELGPPYTQAVRQTPSAILSVYCSQVFICIQYFSLNYIQSFRCLSPLPNYHLITIHNSLFLTSHLHSLQFSLSVSPSRRPSGDTDTWRLDVIIVYMVSQ